MRVLIVEDEPKMAALLAKGMREHGLDAEECYRGDEALERILGEPFDAVVLDIMLPGLDGLALTRTLRVRGNATPVLLLSARGAVDERVEGIEAGADDYVAKPFSVREVAARVKALGRRSIQSTAPRMSIADLTLDPITQEVRRAGRRIEVSRREFLMLEVLFRNAGHVCGRMLFLEKVWDYNFDPGSNLIDVYVRRLRQKVDTDHKRKLIHTIRGAGYTLREDAP